MCVMRFFTETYWIALAAHTTHQLLGITTPGTPVPSAMHYFRIFQMQYRKHDASDREMDSGRKLGLTCSIPDAR